MTNRHNNAIENWLESLGMSAYAASFSSNHIDFDILPTLTKDDLRDLGVRSIGHRRLLLDAAQKARQIKFNAESSLDRTLHWRIITILVFDLVGSTELATRFDPEIARDIILAVRRIVTLAVEASMGHVLRFEGDSIHASFGYPHAQGLDAERAVRAALQCLRDIKAMPPIAGHQPRLRIGAATGPAIVQDTTAEGDSPQVDLGGDVTRIAASAERFARPNELIIAASARKMLGNLFICQALEQVNQAGETAAFWRVEGESRARSRFSALRHLHGDYRLIGRESEIMRLDAWLEAARSGKSTIAFLSGEPGSGKSSIVEHLIYTANAAHAPDFLMQCSPFNLHVALYPMRYLLERLSGFNVYGSNTQNIESIKRFLKSYLDLPQDSLALVYEFMGLDMISTHNLPTINSLEKRQRTLRVLAAIVTALATQSHLLIIEDVQWIDPSTAELFEIVHRNPDSKTWLTVLTSRDLAEPGWLRRLGARRIALDRMSQTEIASVVAQTAHPVVLPEDTLDVLVARADGIPLFAEELTKGYLEPASGTPGHPTTKATIPATLTESLYVRLDALHYGRRVAQLCAAIAREFPLMLLTALQEMPDTDLKDGLRELVEAGVLVKTSGRYGEAYSFRHRLMHEAAYELLLRSERQRLHGKIAEAMMREFADITKTLPHILAYQLAGSGNIEQAAAQWEEAGLQASQHSHYAEAVAYFEQALNANAEVVPSRERDLREFSCRLALVGPLVYVYGPGDPKDVEQIEAASLLCQRVDQKSALISALAVRWGALGNIVSMASNYQLAVQIFELSKNGTRFERMLGHRALGTSKIFIGELDLGQHHLQMAVDLYRPDEDEIELIKIGPSHQIVNAKVGLAQSHALRGDFDAARHWREQALALAGGIGRVNPQYYAVLFAGCFTSWIMRDRQALADFTGQAHALQMLHDPPFWRGHVMLFRGMVLVLEGHGARGIALAREGLVRMGEVRAYWNAWHVQFADACMMQGHLEEAEFWLTAAAQLREDGLGYLTMEAEIIRLSGELAWRRNGDHAAARAAFIKAESLAQSQGAHLFAQRAREALAALP